MPNRRSHTRHSSSSDAGITVRNGRASGLNSFLMFSKFQFFLTDPSERYNFIHYISILIEFLPPKFQFIGRQCRRTMRAQCAGNRYFPNPLGSLLHQKSTALQQCFVTEHNQDAYRFAQSMHALR